MHCLEASELTLIGEFHGKCLTPRKRLISKSEYFPLLLCSHPGGIHWAALQSADPSLRFTVVRLV